MKTTEIHLWTAPLTIEGTEQRGISTLLSPDEQKRAAAFRFEKHRSSFIVGRALLRCLLGRYLGQSAKDISFSYGPKGKPALEGSGTLHFNLAHSNNRIVYALSKASELGVDIEFVRPVPEIESIARSFFSSGECSQLLSLPPEQRTQAFFNCWTRKEAYLKATGDGLMVPLSSFQVSLIPGEPASFLRLVGDRHPISEWELFHLDFSNGYVGALAIPASGCTLRWWTFHDASQCFEYLANSVASF